MATEDERTVDEQGRVTIPAEMRETLGIDSGERVAVELRGDDVVIHADTAPDTPAVSVEEFIETMEGCITEETLREDAGNVDPMDPLGLDDPLGGRRDSD